MVREEILLKTAFRVRIKYFIRCRSLGNLESRILPRCLA